MHFRLTLDDLGRLNVRILSESRGISYIWEPAVAKRMKMQPYCLSVTLCIVAKRCVLEQNASIDSL